MHDGILQHGRLYCRTLGKKKKLRCISDIRVNYRNAQTSWKEEFRIGLGCGYEDIWVKIGISFVKKEDEANVFNALISVALCC